MGYGAWWGWIADEVPDNKSKLTDDLVEENAKQAIVVVGSFHGRPVLCDQ